ncbi:hypothetical protein Vafri_1 [Volvox africanus]|nr:hypothetical protein Vafri_1 [Volvox africanus]
MPASRVPHQLLLNEDSLSIKYIHVGVRNLAVYEQQHTRLRHGLRHTIAYIDQMAIKRYKDIRHNIKKLITAKTEPLAPEEASRGCMSFIRNSVSLRRRKGVAVAAAQRRRHMRRRRTCLGGSPRTAQHRTARTA